MLFRSYIATNPVAETETPKNHHKEKKPLSDREIEQIKVASEKLGAYRAARSLAIFYFLLDTGVRVSELCNIKMIDVDFVQKSVVVLGKGNKERTVYFTDKTLIRLSEYFSFRQTVKMINGQLIYDAKVPLFSCYNKREEKLTPGTIRTVLHKIGNDSGVVRLHPHLVRATFATNLAKKGVRLEVIAELLGHADLNTITKYVLLSKEDLEDAAKTA